MRRHLGTLLVAVGAFLAAFAPLLKFYVAPSVVAAQPDFWKVVTQEGSGASYFDTAKDQQHSGVSLQQVTTYRGNPRAAKNSSVAVWDVFAVLKITGASTNLNYSQQTMAFDRRNGGLEDCCDASVNQDSTVKQSGLGWLFPVQHVQKKNYLAFDVNTRQAWPMIYQASEKVGGIETYRYRQNVPDTLIAALSPIPAKYLGLPKKQPAQPVGEYYSATRTVWVDPRTGVPVKEENKFQTVARNRDLTGQITLMSADLTTTDASQKALVSVSNGYATKYDLVRGWGPVALLVLGLLLLVGGALLQILVFGRRGRDGAGREPEPFDEQLPAAAVPGFRPGLPPQRPRN